MRDIYVRLIYSNKTSTYETLLERDISVSMHHENIQTLATEMFHLKYNLSPEITSNIFIEERKCHYNLQYRKDFRTPPVKSVYHGAESIAYHAPKIWDIVPDKIKENHL